MAKAIRIIGIESLQKAFTEIGETKTKARTQINKALRPAAKIAERAAKQKYKLGSNQEIAGQRYNPSTRKKIVGPSLSDAIGIITAKKSRQPGLFVGPRLKGKFASANWSKANAKNLAELLIRGSDGVRYTKSGKSTGVLPKQPDYLAQVARQKGNQIINVAERDISRLFDKISRKAGFR